MGSLTALFFLALAVENVFGYALAPEVQWPENYHFNAEEINLVTGIVKPFEIWYSSTHNKSRIDLYGGTLSRFYYGMYIDDNDEEHDGKIYMIHPEVSEDDSKTEIKCEVVPSWGDQEDFLPSLEDFTYSGTQEHDGKQVQVWTRNQPEEGLFKIEETLLIDEIDDDVAVPLHHYKKEFNLKDGSLNEDIVINYYNFKNKVPAKVLEANEDDCTSWVRELHDAEKVLHPAINSDVELAFQLFKKHHKRVYEEEEHKFRKMVFRRNWNFIVDHNSKKLGYRLGFNQFADKTMEELSYLSGMRVSDPIREGTHPFPHTEEEIAGMIEEFPETFDLRTEGLISPIRNQAHCGSCWAFAAAATMEGVIARSNGGRVMDLSEQSLVDCAWAFRSHGCGGTEAIDAVYEYLMKHGIPTVREYGPYLEEDGYCKINNMTEVYKIKGFVGVTRDSPAAMKAAVYKYGPITIGVQVTSRMVMYQSGIFYDMECEPGPMNHAVTLVGYGVRNGDLYWIVKNSWGESWGESGYILMSANNDNCNVMHSPYYPIV